MEKTIHIGKYIIGAKETNLAVSPEGKTLVIAEIGVNHNGNLAAAMELVAAAAQAGADAVKFQTFQSRKLVTAGARQKLLTGLELDAGSFHRLADAAREQRMLFLSTPFDEASLEFLVNLGVPALKISSGDLTYLPFLRLAAETGLPVLLSTGMATLGEVETALEVMEGAGCRQIALLHCTSAYPAPLEQANLRVMITLRQAFGLPVGYSDHTRGLAVPLAAVAMGAQVLEKHLTLDCQALGPDHAASCDPPAFRSMILAIREVEAALGDSRKKSVPAEEHCRQESRRSLAAARDLPAGSLITPADITALRPGTGIPPGCLAQVVGQITRIQLAQGEMFTWDQLVRP